MEPRKGPLDGLRVMVLRPRGQAGPLAEGLRRRGARVVLAPAIRIAPPASWSGLDRALRRLRDYDAVVFTSANGVARFFDRARRVLGRRLRKPRKVFAIGPATAGALRRRGWRGSRVPEAFESSALARRLGRVGGWRILIPRAAVAPPGLPDSLRRAGAEVDVVPAYRTLPDRAGRRAILRAAKAGGVDAVAFTSASTVDSFFEAAGAARGRKLLAAAAAAAIGPATAGALRRRGVHDIAQAARFTSQGLVRALVERFGGRGR